MTFMSMTVRFAFVFIVTCIAYLALNADTILPANNPLPIRTAATTATAAAHDPLVIVNTATAADVDCNQGEAGANAKTKINSSFNVKANVNDIYDENSMINNQQLCRANDNNNQLNVDFDGAQENNNKNNCANEQLHVVGGDDELSFTGVGTFNSAIADSFSTMAKGTLDISADNENVLPLTGFVSGTLVSLGSSMTIPIERITANDFVWSIADDVSFHSSGLPTTSAVEFTFSQCGRARVINITWTHTDPDRAFNQSVLCTDNQLFWVVGAGWTAAADLLTDDTLLAHTKSTYDVIVQEISEVVDSGRALCIHSVEIAYTHTFFVGSSGKNVLVHNVKNSKPYVPRYKPGVRFNPRPRRGGFSTGRIRRPPSRSDDFEAQVTAGRGQLGEVGRYYDLSMGGTHSGKHELNHMVARSAGADPNGCAIAMTKEDHAKGLSYGNTGYNKDFIAGMIAGNTKAGWKRALTYEAFDLVKPYKGGSYNNNYKPFIRSLLNCHKAQGHIDQKHVEEIMVALRLNNRPVKPTW